MSVDVGGSLDSRIHAAELALIARDERLRAKASELKAEAHRHTGRVLLWGGAALAATTALAVWFRSRRRHAEPQRMQEQGHRHGQARAEARRGHSPLWSQAMALLLPLLPLGARPRRRSGTGTFGLATSLLMPYALRLLKPTQPLVTAPDVDLLRYAGSWFEVARLASDEEQSLQVSDATTTYALQPDGDIAIRSSHRLADGTFDVVEGSARPVANSGCAHWKVTFVPAAMRWLPLAWTDLYVLGVDDDYQYAVIGSADRQRLWLLSRSVELAPQALRELVDTARAQGYDTRQLRATPHS